jgi:hypothetical protein
MMYNRLVQIIFPTVIIEFIHPISDLLVVNV